MEYSKYILWFRILQKKSWVKASVSLWCLTGIYDQLLSQFIPESVSKNLPKSWELAVMTGGLLPFWAWFLILAAIFIVASFEYGIRSRRRSVESEGITEKQKSEPQKYNDAIVYFRGTFTEIKAHLEENVKSGNEPVLNILTRVSFGAQERVKILLENHLDTFTREAFNKAWNDYAACVLIVRKSGSVMSPQELGKYCLGCLNQLLSYAELPIEHQESAFKELDATILRKHAHRWVDRHREAKIQKVILYRRASRFQKYFKGNIPSNYFTVFEVPADSKSGELETDTEYRHTVKEGYKGLMSADFKEVYKQTPADDKFKNEWTFFVKKPSGELPIDVMVNEPSWVLYP